VHGHHNKFIHGVYHQADRDDDDDRNGRQFQHLGNGSGMGRQ
jgi:hypothetical protein